MTERHVDYMGTNNPFTIVYPSGFRSAPQNLSNVLDIPTDLDLVPPGDRSSLAVFSKSLLKASISANVAHGRGLTDKQLLDNF